MKRLTIKIIPSSLDKILSFSIPTWFLYLFISIISTFGVIFIVLISRQSKIAYDEQKLKTLVEENSYLKARLKILENKTLILKNKIDTLEKYIIALKEVADLDEPPPQLRLFGIGGRINLKKGKFVEIKVETLLLNLDRYLNYAKEEKAYLLRIEKKLKQDEKLRRYTPSLVPTSGLFTSGFGWRRDPFTGQRRFHKGIDIAAPTGTPIIAPADGIVESIKWHHGYGLTLKIKHKLGFSTVYAHLSKVNVKVGQFVKRGQIIAYVGKTGRATGPHLHYEIRLFGKPINPLLYMIPQGEYFD